MATNPEGLWKNTRFGRFSDARRHRKADIQRGIREFPYMLEFERRDEKLRVLKLGLAGAAIAAFSAAIEYVQPVREAANTVLAQFNQTLTPAPSATTFLETVIISGAVLTPFAIMLEKKRTNDMMAYLGRTGRRQEAVEKVFPGVLDHTASITITDSFKRWAHGENDPK